MNDIKTSDIKPPDIKALAERIDMLETRLTFQDETIETLNKTVTQQWVKIDALTRQEAEARVPGATNEPPPHY
jgi:SlyX protein